MPEFISEIPPVKYKVSERRKLGICYTCGIKPTTGKTKCVDCLKSAVTMLTETRKLRRERSLCIKCAMPVIWNKQQCASCAELEKISKNKTTKKLKRGVFDSYGGKCACCGEEDIRLLSLDHINNNGSDHRRELNRYGGQQFYRWVRDNNYPTDLQILCYNCNCGKYHNGGTCPHEDTRPYYTQGVKFDDVDVVQPFLYRAE